MIPGLGLLDAWLFAKQYYVSCPNCARKLHVDPAWRQEVSVGPRFKECHCGVRFETGQREWDELSAKEKRSYLLGENLFFMGVVCSFFAFLGYLARWNDDKWITALAFALFGLFCCFCVLLFTVPIRLHRIRESKRRSRISV